jgi:hypothetical protein
MKRHNTLNVLIQRVAKQSGWPRAWRAPGLDFKLNSETRYPH